MNLKVFELWRNSSLILEEMFRGIRNYSRKPNRLRKPMILKRIQERAKYYPIKRMLPVAGEVLRARDALYDGVSTLIQHIPVWACKHCPEVYIGEGGHLIRTCLGYRHQAKNKAGVDYYDQSISSSLNSTDGNENNVTIPESFSEDDLRSAAMRTLRAWEALQSGVQKLLLVYPARVCKHCSEVHVGPSGHKARTCGVFKYERWHGNHFWEKAGVDDLVPPRLVWYRRSHDPPVLVDEGREYYGRAPAVVDLCSKGGALVPSKYFCMMKMDGISHPV